MGRVIGLAVAVLVMSAVGQGQTATLTMLHNFTGQNGDGSLPDGALVIDKNGALYGTTIGPAATGPDGVLFRLTPSSGGSAWTETVLERFNSLNGEFPNGIVMGSNGAIYGTAILGGAGGKGLVYGFDPAADTSTVLYNFISPAYPDALVIGPDGVLYGTASGGQACYMGCGAVFALTPPATPGGAWTETTLYNFAGGTDGVYPEAAVTIGADGSLYGTTVYGGGTGCGAGYGCGTVFRLTPPATTGGTWTETVLHAFTGGADGSNPYAGLVFGKDGALYGTCQGQYGKVFLLKPPAVASGSWSFEVLYSFKGPPDGSAPAGMVPWGSNGALVGITSAGGIVSSTVQQGAGTVFGLIPPSAAGGPWTEKILYQFKGGSSGQQPVQNLTVGKNGEIFGVTYSGGIVNSACIDGCGGVFKLTL